MKIVLQRVKNASVFKEDNKIASINEGLVLLVGFGKNEDENTFMKMVKKILNGKLFGNWESSVIEMNYEIMVLSQFTLFGQFKGRKLDFHKAENHQRAKEMFEKLVNCFKTQYIESKVVCGIFGVHLQINLTNDGPVTLILDE